MGVADFIVILALLQGLALNLQNVRGTSFSKTAKQLFFSIRLCLSGCHPSSYSDLSCILGKPVLSNKDITRSLLTAFRQNHDLQSLQHNEWIRAWRVRTHLQINCFNPRSSCAQQHIHFFFPLSFRIIWKEICCVLEDSCLLQFRKVGLGQGRSKGPFCG